jgi:hypothetical protein
LAFDAYLAARGLGFEAVVVGGTALNLLGVISRATQDCDILDPQLAPEHVRETFEDLARKLGHGV